MLLTFCSLILDSGVVPPGSEPYPYFTAIQAGLSSALCACLMINGFVGFQLYEDGTRLSVWLLRLVSFAFFIITFLVSVATFKSWAGLGPNKTVGLFVVLYIINGLCLLVYVVMQVILVVNTLQDRWPLGDIAFGSFFLVIGQVILYVFSNTICRAVQHYLDGLFFATICNLLAVMMVYKVCCVFISIPFSSNRGNRMKAFADVSSTGTPSRKKTSNSPSAPSRTTGKLKNYFRKMTTDIQSTRTRITRALSTAARRCRQLMGCLAGSRRGIRPMGVSIIR
jgi:glucan phosphoethanolaminetransferase (alkaline phosphatase superfamily)